MASGKRRDVVLSLGADEFLDYAVTDLATMKGQFDLIFDAAGKVPFKKYEKLLAATGRFTPLGCSSLPIRNFINRLRGKSQRGYSGYSAHDGKSAELSRLVELLLEGKIRPLIERSYNLDEINLAHKHAETEHKLGSLLILMDG